MDLIATPEDIGRIIDMVARLTEAVSGPQMVDRAHTGKTLAGLMANPQGVVFATSGGFLAATIGQTVINPEPIAYELGWFAEDGKGLRLLRAFERWAASHGARPQISTGPTGPDLSRLGYRLVEQAWIKD